MKIVFNGLQFSKYNSGIGKMMEMLFSAMTNKFHYKSALILPKDSQESIQNVETIKIPYKNSEGFRRNFYQTFIMGRKHCQDSILVITDSKVPFFMPRNSYILPIITDLALYEMPEVYKFSRVFLWRMQYKYLVKHTKRFIAVSEYTKNDINKFLGIDKERIDVVYCAADANIKIVESEAVLEKTREKYSLPDKYFLFIGNLNPRKNLFRLYKAYKKVKEKLNIPHKLVIAGAHGWKYEKLLKLLKEDRDVVFTGYIDEVDKASLYTMADAFVFPSLHEGFGIPILEAQQCGVSVIASNVSAIPEVAGKGALYIDPYSIDDISKKLEEVLTNNNLKEKLIEEGYKNAKRFSWEDSSKKMNEIIDSILEV